ncbi:MAG: ABC transporter permease [Caldilineaceae bacterium]|nr:ABC transporter permease [Caldilineaceae bacterium]
MTQYIIRRLLITFPMLIVITYLNFSLMRLAPGDPTLFMFVASDTQGMTPQQVRDQLGIQESYKGRGSDEGVSTSEYLHERLGLNDPIPVQYVRWLGKVLQGDFGRAMRTAELITPELAVRIGVTVRLTVLSTLLSVFIGVVVGSLSAIYQYSTFDNVVSFLTYILISVPGFLLATWVIIIFAIRLGWFPSGSLYNPRTGGDFWDRAYHLILPVLAMGISGSAHLIRWTRSSVLETMRADYVTVARAKGMKETVVRSRHIFRNALLPVVTIIGRSVPFIIGGSVFFERAFNFPGLGMYTALAAEAKDFSIMIATVTVIAVMVVLSNLVVDICYVWVDPRVSYS